MIRTPSRRTLLGLAALVLGLTATSCRKIAPSSGASHVFSGGGTDPTQLGCDGLRATFIDDGAHLDLATKSFVELTGATAPESTAATTATTATTAAAATTAKESWLGVSKDEPFRGALWPLISDLTIGGGLKLRDINPYSLQATLGSCLAARDAFGDSAYDACTEMFLYAMELRAVATTWDNNQNGKKCYEGPGSDTVVSPEFGYCENECAFTGETCNRCAVRLEDGTEHSFVCKSRSSALDAVSGFCRNNGVRCIPIDPAVQCQSGDGREIAGGHTTSLGGQTDESFNVSLAGYAGATAKLSVNAGVAGGESLSARGTLTGTVGYRVVQKVGRMFTESGIGEAGLRVQCFLQADGVANVAYDTQAGLGADLLFAKGGSTVDAGGSFSLTKAYTKTSPTFSGAGQSKDTIYAQCMNNYVGLWLGVELQNWVDEYHGLALVKKSVERLQSDLGLDATLYVADTRQIYCTFPDYDPRSAYQTAGVWIYFEDEPRLDFGFMQRFGLDALWPDAYSGKLTIPNGGEALRPYLRDLQRGTLTGDRLAAFFNDVVVPASQSHKDARWHTGSCRLRS